jgi:DnaJ-domain-containing protein 1
MPRPDRETKRGIEQRRAANAKLRDDAAAREKQMQARVQSIIATALDRPRLQDTLPGLHDLIQRLEAAYDLAMAATQPKAAIDATMAMGRLLGLVIDRSAVAIGDLREAKEEAIRNLEEEIGPAAFDRVMKMHRLMRLGDAKSNAVLDAEFKRLGFDDGADADDTDGSPDG